MNVQLKIINPLLQAFLSNSHNPTPLQYATPGSAGCDLRACISKPLTIYPNQASILIPTGLAIHLQNPNVFAMIAPRSSLGHKHGLILGNTIGVLDSDYQQEIFISAWLRPHTTSDENQQPYTIQPFDRIAQLLILPVIQATFTIGTDFNQPTERMGGFGSTGKS